MMCNPPTHKPDAGAARACAVNPRRAGLFPAALLAAALLVPGVPAAAQQADLDALFDRLADADADAAAAIADQIAAAFSRSGSPAMDLLLDRGRKALATSPEVAVGHLSALVDHAPDFAEGYNARAAAFFQLGSYGEAVEDLRRALELEPRHFGAMTGLAVILEELGYEQGALLAWRQVVALYPSQPQAEGRIEQLERAVEGVTL